MNTKIKIVRNESVWTTRSIKKILIQTFKEFKKWHFYPFTELRINIGTSRINILGKARLNFPYVFLGLPKDLFFFDEPNVSLALVFYHELQHNIGFDHKIIGTKIDKDAYPDFSFLEQDKFKLILKPKKEKKKIKQDLQIKRYNRIITVLEDKQKKFKRLQNSIKKLLKKKRYYERVLIAAGKLPVESKEVKL